MKTLHVLCGLPRSGKTTYRNTSPELKDKILICPDDIRLTVYRQRFNPKYESLIWEIAYEMLNVVFYHTDEVVYDATNINKKTRRKILDIIKYNDIRDIKVIAYFLTTPKEVCIERAKATNQKDLIPIIEKMAANFENPSLDEGFDNIILVESK